MIKILHRPILQITLYNKDQMSLFKSISRSTPNKICSNILKKTY